MFFPFAIRYSELALEQPHDKPYLDSRLLASLLFSHMTLETHLNELLTINKVLLTTREKSKKSFTNKLKDFLKDGGLGSQEPYNSVKLLDELRNHLVHAHPVANFEEWEESGVQKRSAVAHLLEKEFRARSCIPEDSDIAVFPLRAVTVECTNWACDTVYLMVLQLDKLARKRGYKQVLPIIERGGETVFLNYVVRSKYFAHKKMLVGPLKHRSSN
jgi:hypothetical protein